MNEDLSNLFEKLNINKDIISPDMINNLMNMLNNNSSDNNESSSNTSTNNIDFETILKMKSVMDRLNNNNNDPRANLLLSLKPYLKDSRKEKLDQYIQLLKISKVLDIFPFSGGETKNANKQ